MLSELNIANFALIDRLRVEFGPGLNVLTGETGAGKSILIDAIGAVLGERAGQELIRTGASRATVDAVFDLEMLPGDTPPANGRSSDHAAQELPIVEGAGPRDPSAVNHLNTRLPWEEWVEDGRLLIAREVSAGGRSQARLNGRPIAAGTLRELSRHLVDLHGQHEHQSLLNADRHGAILDGWIGAPALELGREIAALCQRWNRLKNERSRLMTDERERARRLDLYRFEAAEIDAAQLVPGEEESLEADRTRLAGAERLASALEESLHLLSEGDAAALEALATTARRLLDAAVIDAAIQPLAEAVEGALFGLEEAGRDIRRARDGVEFNPERLNAVHERLDLLRSLRRKYGDSLSEVLAYRERIGAELEDLEHGEERLATLDSDVTEAESALRARCARLTDIRTSAAGRFCQLVMAELADLAMQKTRFEVRITPQEPSTSGADDIEFLLSANPGEPVKPLARIASGGEMSRIMLALKSITAQTDRIPVMIFDEIDAGVGGRTAGVLAQKLRSLAADAQILCVTHLPQVAAAAHRHIAISKSESDGRTIVTVREVEGKERVAELARMLGNAESPIALQHAREMLGAIDTTRRLAGRAPAGLDQPSLFGEPVQESTP